MARYKCDRCKKTVHKTGLPSQHKGEPCPRVYCTGTLVKR